MKAMKIYGMRGLLEWHGTVHSKDIRMKVDFTNGSVTAYGVAPATFITNDTLTQTIIENSDEFKSGRIRLERTVPLPGEVDKRVIEPKVDGLPVEGEPMVNENHNENVTEEVPVEEPAADNGGVQKVSVADKNDAIEWLKEHNPEAGYTASKLRSKEAFDAACKECDVEFIY